MKPRPVEPAYFVQRYLPIIYLHCPSLLVSRMHNEFLDDRLYIQSLPCHLGIHVSENRKISKFISEKFSWRQSWLSASHGIILNPLFQFIYFCTPVYFKIVEKKTTFRLQSHQPSLGLQCLSWSGCSRSWSGAVGAGREIWFHETQASQIHDY